MAYCKFKLGLTDGSHEEIHIIESSPREMDKKIVIEANNFAGNHGAWMPYDYFCDEGDPSHYVENAVHMWIEFLDSDIMDEDTFEVMWDNYMKALGRNRL